MTHGSLFSGIGGFDLGAERAGIKNLWNCEVDEHRRKILQRHFPATQQFDDVHNVKDNVPWVDIITGGFPCQDISIGNNKFRNDKTGNYGIRGLRSGLWTEFRRIIGQIKPKYIFIENSPMLAVRGLEYVLCDLAKSGYNAEWRTISAQEFGFPHVRKRLFIVAYSVQIGLFGTNEYFSCLQKLLHREPPGQADLPLPLKRFNAYSIDKLIRIDNGFSRGLDRRRIEDCGNAVIPLIAEYLFRALIEFDRQRQTISRH